MSACMLAYLRFDVAAMLGDLRMAAGARAESLGRCPAVDRVGPCVGLARSRAFQLRHSALVWQSRHTWRGLKLPIVGAFLFFADIGLISSNAQSGSFPVCAVFAILVLSEITEDQQDASRAEGHSLRPITERCFAWERCCFSRNSQEIWRGWPMGHGGKRGRRLQRRCCVSRHRIWTLCCYTTRQSRGAMAAICHHLCERRRGAARNGRRVGMKPF